MLNQPWLKPVMECSLVSGALPWTFWILTIAGMIAVLAFLIIHSRDDRGAGVPHQGRES